MSQANAKIAGELSAIINTIEVLIEDLGRISTTAFENTMPNAKVAAVKDKRDIVKSRVNELHSLMLEAGLASDDSDVVARSGGGGGK